MTPFDLAGPLPSGRTVLEASAGTGKTYSLTGLIVRYIAEQAVPVDQLLVVTFTRAAANELRDRTRTTLDLAAVALRSGVAPDAHPWLAALLRTNDGSAEPSMERARRLQRVSEAVTHFDELTITTIHGFCQQALAQLGVRAGNNPDAVLVESVHDVITEVCRDAIITVLADDPGSLNTQGSSHLKIINPKQAETELIAVVTSLMSTPGAQIAPADSLDPLASRWVALALHTHDEVVRRQQARNEVGYDTLISGLQRALIHPDHGDTVAAQLAQRSSVVLVDEFQDTDRLQWEVFERAFSGRTLITVGDPKQAIYRFRGADVHAYLDAVHAAPAQGLTTNHRSDRAVLDGLAHLFDGATLGDARIGFVPVLARPDAPRSAIAWLDTASSGDNPDTPDNPGASDTLYTPVPRPEMAAVGIRVVPPDDSLRSASGQGLAMPLVRTLVLDDLVARVIDLLDHATIETDVAGKTAGATVLRPVRPADIAVLVPSHLEANNVAAALRRARIPAVRTRTGSVLQSPAATQWRLLLAALAQPHQTPMVRAGALGWFLRTDVLTLADDDEVLAELQRRTADLADLMRNVGISAFYDQQKARLGGPDGLVAGLVPTVLGRDGGDRHLTDLDHISELLADALQGRAADPGQVLRVLDGLISDTDERNEAAMRRIDSDALAVQITTIHSAKGLEYPIVLVPFGFKPRGTVHTPYSYTGVDGQRSLDLASRIGWDGGVATPGNETTRQNQEMRRHLATLEVEGDELRLLYVALTRAQHWVEIWWASTLRAGTSALARVLTDRSGAGPVLNTDYSLTAKKTRGFSIGKPSHQTMDHLDAMNQIQQLARDSDGTIACTVIDPAVVPNSWGGHRQPSVLPLVAATPGARRSIGDPTWTRWSFSRLGSLVEALAAPADASVGDLRAGNDRADERTDRGGFDEPVLPGELDDLTAAGSSIAGVDADDTEHTVVPVSTQQMRLDVGPIAHLADIVGGTRFGTFVHAVLEDLDPTAHDLADTVRALVVDHAAREGLDLGHDETTASVVAGIVAAVRTPLGPLFGGRALTDISTRDRLAELTFDLPINAGLGAFPAGLMGEVLLRHLPKHDPMLPFARQLAREFAGLDIAGWMHGSIDGVFRVDVGGEQRFVVVDYKTNRLHEPGTADPVAAYHPRLLVPAMEHSRYPLQALLYTLALHRYLRWRLGSTYEPDQHLGGTAYLFVRGMVGPDTPVVDGVPHGVFSWRPPASAVLALDHLFATGVSS